MLKLFENLREQVTDFQPPSGGCVLKRPLLTNKLDCWIQPPSGGCVLKLLILSVLNGIPMPAAFGRLCVETQPAIRAFLILSPAAFGRLCVETVLLYLNVYWSPPSRLRAAVC